MSEQPSINFLELPQEKIDDYIKILQEFQDKSEQEGKFVEAELAKQRIFQLLKVKDKQELKEIKEKHAIEKKELEDSQKEELNEFNMKMDHEFYKLSQKFQEEQTKLEQKHEEELQNLEKLFEEKNNIIKPTSELINLNKKLELYVKKKDYINAHQIQIDIANLSQKEKEKCNQENQNRFEKEIENYKKKQDNETKALEQKIQTNYNNFKKERALKVESLLLKYKNRLRELEKKQKNEISKLEKKLKDSEKGIKPKKELIIPKPIVKKSTNNSKITKK